MLLARRSFSLAVWLRRWESCTHLVVFSKFMACCCCSCSCCYDDGGGGDAATAAAAAAAMMMMQMMMNARWGVVLADSPLLCRKFPSSF